MPDEPEAHGLLALMLLHDARRDARAARRRDRAARGPGPRAAGTSARSPAGAPALDRAIALRGRGPYVLQAAIASLHVERRARLAADRGALRRARAHHGLGGGRAEPRRSPIAQVEGAERGLELIDALPLDGYRYLHSTRAELLRRSGRTSEARAAYERALELDAQRARAAAAASCAWLGPDLG